MSDEGANNNDGGGSNQYAGIIVKEEPNDEEMTHAITQSAVDSSASAAGMNTDMFKDYVVLVTQGTGGEEVLFPGEVAKLSYFSKAWKKTIEEWQKNEIEKNGILSNYQFIQVEGSPYFFNFLLTCITNQTQILGHDASFHDLVRVMEVTILNHVDRLMNEFVGPGLKKVFEGLPGLAKNGGPLPCDCSLDEIVTLAKLA